MRCIQGPHQVVQGAAISDIDRACLGLPHEDDVIYRLRDLLPFGTDCFRVQTLRYLAECDPAEPRWVKRGRLQSQEGCPLGFEFGPATPPAPHNVRIEQASSAARVTDLEYDAKMSGYPVCVNARQLPPGPSAARATRRGDLVLSRRRGGALATSGLLEMSA
jgi:hypothetical protein